MRKTSLMLLGALAGAAVTVIAIQPPAMLTGAFAKTAPSETYRQLNLFGDVFERVRTRLCRESPTRKADRCRHQRHAVLARPHSSYMNAKTLPRHAGPDARRVRRPRHRGHHGERPHQGRVADRRHAGGQRRHPRQRPHHRIIDGEPVQGLTLNQAVDKMRGPVNTKIKLSIMRKGGEGADRRVVTRDVIRINSVRSRVEGDDVGYIRITSFNEQTETGLKKAMSDSCDASLGDKLQRLHHRSAQQSGRPARSGDFGLRCLPQPAARSFRPAAATPRRPSASTPGPATWPRASRSLC